MALYHEEQGRYWTSFNLLHKSAKGGFYPAHAALERMNICLVMLVLQCRLLDKEGNPRHPGKILVFWFFSFLPSVSFYRSQLLLDNLFLLLPRDVVFYLFKFL